MLKDSDKESTNLKGVSHHSQVLLYSVKTLFTCCSKHSWGWERGRDRRQVVHGLRWEISFKADDALVGRRVSRKGRRRVTEAMPW